MLGRKEDTTLSPSAVKRLLRDWEEVRSNPLPTISAAPLQDDLQEWHCNLCPSDGPYAGATFHLELHFPSNYPLQPPVVKLRCRTLKHPNVFGFGICLDMLNGGERATSSSYSGWSSAYTVHSILLQLQSFLFGESVEQGHGERKSMEEYTCESAVARTREEVLGFRWEP